MRPRSCPSRRAVDFSSHGQIVTCQPSISAAPGPPGPECPSQQGSGTVERLLGCRIGAITLSVVWPQRNTAELRTRTGSGSASPRRAAAARATSAPPPPIPGRPEIPMTSTTHNASTDGALHLGGPVRTRTAEFTKVRFSPTPGDCDRCAGIGPLTPEGARPGTRYIPVLRQAAS